MVNETNMYYAEINIQRAIEDCTDKEELYIVFSRIVDTFELYEAIKVKELEEDAEN